MKSEDPHQQQFWVKTCLLIFLVGQKNMVWYDIVEFNVPLDTGHFGDGGPKQWCASPIK